MQLGARLLIGLVLSLLIALIALRRRSLSRSGAYAAVLIGTVIFVGGGPTWFLALVTFFVSSTLLGRVGRERKAAVKREFEKGDVRDAFQALSNGGVAAVCALGMALSPHAAWAAGFIGALATANADTWATELGVLSRAEPWSLLRLSRVPRGTSGAISPLGLAVTVFGGLAIGAVAALPLMVLGAASGFLGALLDSLLGALFQAGYYCPECRRDSEGARHVCGALSMHARGLSWFDNDGVNLVATLGGALLAALGVLALT
jgi:uncharacterized protein (TIGR00297 family)